MRITHHDLSSRIADSKATDIIGTGASLAATGCPACRMQIQNGLARAGSGIRVVHTIQIVARALGLDARCRIS
jgi:glycolate oxidase iron-sulfur subunit